MDIQKIASLQRKYLESPEWEAFTKEYEKIMENKSKIKVSKDGEVSYKNVVVVFPKYINLNNKILDLLDKMKNILVDIDDELQRATLEESETLKTTFESKKMEYTQFLEEHNAFKKIIDDEEAKIIKMNTEYTQMYNQYYKLYHKRRKEYSKFKIIMDKQTTKKLFDIYNKEKVLTEKRAKQVSKSIGLNGDSDDVLEIMNRWKYFQVCEQYIGLQKNIQDLLKNIETLTKDKNHLINNFILEFPQIKFVQVSKKEEKEDEENKQEGGAQYKHISIPSQGFSNSEDNFSNYFMVGGEYEESDVEGKSDGDGEGEESESDVEEEGEESESDVEEEGDEPEKQQFEVGGSVININLTPKKPEDEPDDEQDGGG